MAVEELKKFSEELKKTREAEEIELDEISSKTRIDLKFLKAIEEGNFEIMPDVYIRAFIKEYAAYIQLDPTETLKKFDLAKKGKSMEVKEKESSPLPKEEEKRASRKEFSEVEPQSTDNSNTKLQSKKLIIYGLSGFLILALLGVYFIFIKDSSPEIVIERPFEEILDEKKTENSESSNRFQVEEETSPSDVGSEVQDSLSLHITANDTCWVNITIDNSASNEYMFYPNNSKLVKAKSRFDLIIGNLGGIDLLLNGNSLSVSGTAGKRKVIAINKNGIVSTPQ